MGRWRRLGPWVGLTSLPVWPSDLGRVVPFLVKLPRPGEASCSGGSTAGSAALLGKRNCRAGPGDPPSGPGTAAAPGGLEGWALRKLSPPGPSLGPGTRPPYEVAPAAVTSSRKPTLTFPGTAGSGTATSTPHGAFPLCPWKVQFAPAAVTEGAGPVSASVWSSGRERLLLFDVTRVRIEHLWGVSPLTRTLGKWGAGARLPLPRVRPQAECPTFPFFETNKNLSFCVKPPDIQIWITKLKHVNAVPGKRTVVPGESGSCREPKSQTGCRVPLPARGPQFALGAGVRDAVSPPPAPGPTPAYSGPRDGDTFPG